MNDILSSVILGITFTALYFLLSVVLTLGGKILYAIIKEKLSPKVPQKINYKIKKHVNRKPVRKIELDPNEDYKIFVKKSS